MSSWETVELEELERWIHDHQSALGVPAAFAVGPPDLVLTRVRELNLEAPIRVDPRSGSMQIDVRGEATQHYDATELLHLGEVVSLSVDQREAEVAAVGEDDPGMPRTVIAEAGLRIGELLPVGPGGRITVFGRRQVVEVVCRPRVADVGGVWRDPGSVADDVLAAFGGDVGRELRLRLALGYFEAAADELQEVIRPTVVAILDNAADAAEHGGPRWQLAAAVAASEIDGGDAADGLGSAVGCV